MCEIGVVVADAGVSICVIFWGYMEWGKNVWWQQWQSVDSLNFYLFFVPSSPFFSFHICVQNQKFVVCDEERTDDRKMIGIT